MFRMSWLGGALATLGSLVVGCQGSSSSDLNVFNGTETTQYDGSVVRLLVDQGRRRFCTGVVVDASTALMAAHCIKSSTVETSILAELRAAKDGVGQVKAKRYYSWSAVRNMETLTDEAAARDLAVVVFDGAPFKGPYLKLASHIAQGKSADLNSPVKIVGFGAANFGLNAGTIKGRGAQVGDNRISEVKKGLYILTANLSPSAPRQGNAAAAAGDAGGPLLNANGELLGIGAGIRLLKQDKVTSTGIVEDESKYAAPRPEQAAFAQNSFVDLSSETSKKLLGFAIAAEKKLGHEVKIVYVDSSSGSSQTLPAPKEVTFSPDDTSWLSDPNKDRSGDWVAAAGRFIESTSINVSQKGLGLLQAYSESCVNGVCQRSGGPNASSASTSMGGGLPGGGGGMGGDAPAGWGQPGGGGASSFGGGSPGGAFSQSCVNGVCKTSGGPGATSAITSMGPGVSGISRPTDFFDGGGFGMPMPPPFVGFGPGLMQPPMPPSFMQMPPANFGGGFPAGGPSGAGWGPAGAGANAGPMQISAPGGMFGGPEMGPSPMMVPGMGFTAGDFGQSMFFDPW